MLLGLCDRTVLERVDVDEDAETVVAHVRPKRPKKRRCGVCGRPAPREDEGSRERQRWRSPGLGHGQGVLGGRRAPDALREHGRVVAAVPGARHGARQTRAFEDQVAWLVTRCSKTAVSALMRVVWRTVGAIVARVVADIDAQVDRLEGLRRIGIDEISYKRGHKNDGGGRPRQRPAGVGCGGPGHEDAAHVLRRAGSRALQQITHVSADAADWIAAVVAERCPPAVRCADPTTSSRGPTRR